MKDRLQDRQHIVRIIIILVVTVLLAKAAHLQIFDKSYREKAEATTIDLQTLYPSRGLLYDRNGKLLVYNDAIYDLEVTVNLMDPQMDTLKFCQLLDIDKAQFVSLLNKDFTRGRYSKSIPFTFLKKIPPETFASFQELMHEFPGFTFVLRNARGYPHAHAAHVLGYISEVDQNQLDKKGDVYEIGDYAGTSGLEAQYENLLRGRKGISYVLKDNLGRDVGPMNEGLLDSSAVSGQDLMISIDLDVQAYAELLMTNKKGSIVAIEPSTGEILSMVSAPSYDPNLLTVNRNRGKAFAELLSDTLRNPFFNRTIMAKYPPGSTIKPILALIGLQEGVINPYKQVVCDGAYHYKHYSWGCHAGPGVHNMTSAIQKSCNTYFYGLYRELVEQYGFNEPGRGLDELKLHMQRFGLGKTLGVDFPNEQGGHIPDDAFYKEMYSDEGGRWYATYIISNGIGQGEIELTTIQMANLAAILANRGYYFTPHLLRASDETSPQFKRYQDKYFAGIDEEHFPPVIEGMERAISNGTAGLAYIPDIKVCGKTGTSENPHGKDHSVFYAFAPREDPKIAIAVYIENGGWGGSYAAPIGSLIIEKYLKGKISDRRLWIEQRMIEADLITQNSEG